MPSAFFVDPSVGDALLEQLCRSRKHEGDAGGIAREGGYLDRRDAESAEIYSGAFTSKSTPGEVVVDDRVLEALATAQR